MGQGQAHWPEGVQVTGAHAGASGSWSVHDFDVACLFLGNSRASVSKEVVPHGHCLPSVPYDEPMTYLPTVC